VSRIIFDIAMTLLWAALALNAENGVQIAGFTIAALASACCVGLSICRLIDDR